MRLFRYSWLLLFLPVLLHGQYIGSGRPWTAAQSSDSLAAVNARVDADSMRLDSLREVLGDSIQAVQAEMYDSLWARVDSAFKTEMYDSLANKEPLGGGGGGGGGFPYDTLAFDVFFGFESYADEPSNFVLLDGSANDSASGDSLIYYIDQYKTTGGKFLVLPGGTIQLYNGSGYDSLPTSGGIVQPIRIYGVGRHESTIEGLTKANNVYALHTTVDKPFGDVNGVGGLYFYDIGLKANVTKTSSLGVIGKGAGGFHIEAENCLLTGAFFALQNGGVDSVATFRSCELDNMCFQFNQGNPVITLAGCYGYLYYFRHGGSTGTKYYVNWIGGEGILEVGSIVCYGQGAGEFKISGGIYHILYTNAMFAVEELFATGAQFIWPSSGTHRAIQVTAGHGSVNGCRFLYGGLHLDHRTDVSGNHFELSPIGIDIDKANIAVSANTSDGCAVFIDVAGSLSNVVVHGNSGYNNTTDINGTPDVDTDNNFYP